MSNKRKKADEDTHVSLRMPGELRKALIELSERDHRTVSGTIIHLLYKQIEKEKVKT